MNTYAKGYRNERKAMEYWNNKGYTCWRAKITRHGKNDFFGLFDLICVPDSESTHGMVLSRPTVWVQVKSNYISQAVLTGLQEFVKRYFYDPCNIAQAMVWHDRKGWEIIDVGWSHWTRRKEWKDD